MSGGGQPHADQHAIAIETLFDEQREFPPSAEFAAQANVNDPCYL